MDIFLNGTQIKSPKPNELNISTFNITEGERLGNGDISLDFIAQKTRLNFNYEALTQSQYQTIQDIVTDPSLFFTLRYSDNDVDREITCYAGEFARTAFRASTAVGWVWRNVRFSLIER